MPIVVLSNKKYREEDVKIEKVKSRRKHAAEIDSRIEKGWKTREQEANAKGWLFFNGPLVRFEGFGANDKLLIKVSDAVWYKDVVGLRAEPFDDLYKKFGADFMPNALSAMTIAVTKDDKLPMGLRHTGDWGVLWEVSGGFVVESRDKNNPFATCRNNLSRDFLNPNKNPEIKNKIIEITMIGLYEYPEIAETTACFFVKIDHDCAHVLEQNKQNSKGYLKIIFLGNNKEAIKKFIESEREKMHYPSTAALEHYVNNCL